MNVTNFLVPNIDGTNEEWVDIDWGNDQHTSMPKATYDAQQSQTEPTIQ